MSQAFKPSANPEQRLKAVASLMAELNSDSQPILVGPYRSELGFEVLYWCPFLRFLSSHVKDFHKRAVVLTRGGLGLLYKDIAEKSLDLYTLRTPQDIRRENLYDHQNTKLQKQMSPTRWDEAVLSDAARVLNLGALYHTVHPAWMYWSLAPFWDEDRGLKHLTSVTDYALLPKPLLDGLGLPPKYVAVKFYARATFPYPHPEIAEFVQKTVGILAAQVPVVMVSSGSNEFDDHEDIHVSGENVYHLPPPPADQNLLVQAAVIAGATCFVGTYGGAAQLALRMGIRSVSFWSEFGGTCPRHLDLSNHLSHLTKVPFVTGAIGESLLWQQVTQVVKPFAAPVRYMEPQDNAKLEAVCR